MGTVLAVGGLCLCREQSLLVLGICKNKTAVAPFTSDIPAIKGAYTGINIKLMKCTGMREAWKMLNYAKAEGMKVMTGCMTETSCAVSAAAQLSPAVDFADLDGNLLISNDRFEGMTVENGKITLPDRPGIGLKLI